MDSNQLSMYSTLTFIYQIYLVMPAPPQFPDVGVFTHARQMQTLY